MKGCVNFKSNVPVKRNLKKNSLQFLPSWGTRQQKLQAYEASDDNVQILRSSHIFIFWFLVCQLSIFFFFCLENKFLIGQTTKIFSVKTGFEELKKKCKQTWQLIV